MTRTMSKMFNLCAVCFIVLVVGAFMAPGISQAEEIELEIAVAPYVINLESPVDSVTIHVPITCKVDRGTIELCVNGALVEPEYFLLFCDTCGDLVLRYYLEDIKDSLVIYDTDDTDDIPPNTFEVWGTTDFGVEFHGIGYVKKVVEIVPQGSGGSR